MACIFCEIVTGLAGAELVHRDEARLVILDRAPLFPGHCLVLPAEHYAELADCPPELYASLSELAQRVALAQRRALGCDGNFVAANAVISQSVPHLHIHVVPRRRKDGLHGFFWPRTRYGSPEEAASVAASLREALAPS
ncbi:MAG: HIT family protein [Actinomycetota bacterium]|nr:HIT family protein [Actinomycetota bacterium]